MRALAARTAPLLCGRWSRPAVPLLRPRARSAGAAASAADADEARVALAEWHAALAAAQPPRRLLLPQGHPDGSLSCDTLALLGDALLKVSALRVLGCADEARHGRHLNEYTADVAGALCNATLCDAAVTVLVPPGDAGGVAGAPLNAHDLTSLPRHGRATSVEAAVALVHAAHGAAPVDGLARVLLRRVAAAGGVTNWKGLLLELGGALSVASAAGGGTASGFVATATVRGVAATSDAWPSKLAAESQAAQAAMRAAGLGSAAERTVASAEDAKQAMRAASNLARSSLGLIDVSADEKLQFRPVAMTEQSVARASEAGAAWFLRGAQKDTFHRMMGAPLALPRIVHSVRTWVATTRGGDEFAVMSVTHARALGSGGDDQCAEQEAEQGHGAVQQRWFFAGPQPSTTKAKVSVARVAVHALRLVEAAQHEERTEQGETRASHRSE
jgi:hypothetical protein